MWSVAGVNLLREKLLKMVFLGTGCEKPYTSFGQQTQMRKPGG